MKKKLPEHVGFRIPPKFRWGFLILVAIYLFWSLRPFSKVSLSPDRIEMEPIVAAGKTIYLYSRPKKEDYLPGDVLYFYKNGKSPRLAWVAGLPGDKLELKGNRLSGENGVSFDLIGVPADHSRTYPPVPKGHIFLVQRDQSLSIEDSLTEGPYPLESLTILGKIFFNFPKEDELISTEDSSPIPEK